MASPQPTPITGDLDLSENAFWALPPAQRHAAYARLRALEPPPFFEAGESPFGAPERGYYALVRHADVAEASRNPQLFSSAAGATSIIDLPAEFNEYFGSMINMDDPAARPAAPDRLPRVHPEDDQEVRGGRAADRRRSSSTTCCRPARATSCSTCPPGSRSRSSAR